MNTLAGMVILAAAALLVWRVARAFSIALDIWRKAQETSPCEISEDDQLHFALWEASMIVEER